MHSCDGKGAGRPGRSVAGMLAMCVLVGMGERMAERFLPLYLLALGGGTWAIGAFNGLNNLLNALYALPGGRLADRIGHRRALFAFTGMAIAGYAIVLLVPRWWAVLAGAALFISWTALSLPAIMSLVSSALPENRRTLGVSLHSLIRRIPMALGPVLGGWIMTEHGVETGTRVAFAVAILLALLALGIQARYIHEDRSPAAPKEFAGLWARFDPALRGLLVSDILIRFAEQIPYAFAVVWVVKICHLTPAHFGLLTAVEMITAMLVYLPVAWLADRGHKKPWVLTTFVFFTAFPVALFFARSFWPLVLAFVLRGLKEFGEPARKALILDLAPAGARATAFGLYYLIRDLVVSVAAFGGAWLWHISPAANLFTAAACGALGTIWFVVRGRDFPRPSA